MAFSAPSTTTWRRLVGVGVLVVGLALTGSLAVAQSDDTEPDGGPAASFLADLLGPDESFAPVEIELTGSLPRSATFQGVELVVERVHLTNTHPYTMFGEPRPGELFYVVVEVTARNPTEYVYEYGLGDETFDFRTWSGRLLARVPAPGRYAFDRLEPGGVESDMLVFGSEVPDVLDGSALLVGRPPDTPLVIPLTAPPLPADYPTPVQAARPGPYQAGAIAWSILGGEASLDRPPGVCCPETGSRADDGELFVTLQLSGRVDGSQYGQASVTTDAVRLIVDGVPVAPFGFDGQANVPEGEAYEFPATWLVRDGDAGLALQLLDGADVVESVPLFVGEAAPAGTAGPRPSAAVQAASPSPAVETSTPAQATSPVPASPSPAPTTAPTPAPTARPVMAAIATLLIYSGRPDPDWALTAEDLERLASIAAGLNPTEGGPPEGGLGYRGFRVTGPKGTWRANGGVVTTPDSAPGTSLADPERLVERYLLETGRGSLSAEEAAAAEAELETDPVASPG